MFALLLILQTRTRGSRKAAHVVIRIQLLVELLPSILPSPYLRSFPDEENPSSLTLPDRFHNPHVVAFISIFIVIIAAVLLLAPALREHHHVPQHLSVLQDLARKNEFLLLGLGPALVLPHQLVLQVTDGPVPWHLHEVADEELQNS